MWLFRLGAAKLKILREDGGQAREGPGPGPEAAPLCVRYTRMVLVDPAADRELSVAWPIRKIRRPSVPSQKPSQ